MTSGIGILYEHPEWFKLLFGELERRGIPYTRIAAERLVYDPESKEQPRLVVNRMSPSSWSRGNGNGLFAVRDYLEHLEDAGVAVVNGAKAYAVEISKAKQIDLFRRAGVGYPRAHVINHVSMATAAAKGLRYPLLLKPNIGGSGAGIVRVDSPEDLLRLPENLGVDGTALIQELLPARDGYIVRVEVLDGKFLYAIRIFPDLSSFNLCPADICQVGSGAPKKQMRVERFDPPREAIDGALALASMAHLDVGGIEYLVNDRDGQICYYDINALSNFVTDAVNVIGFDPTARFVDYLERRLAKTRGA